MDELRCKIELRAEGDGPGRLVGTLLTYGERASDRAEVFEPHALTWPDGGIVLRRQHSRAAPIMRATPLERDGAVVFDEATTRYRRGAGRSRRNTKRTVYRPVGGIPSQRTAVCRQCAPYLRSRAHGRRTGG